MKEINNIRQLQKALQPILIDMVDTLADRVYETLNYFLQDYYTGWTPASYKRTQEFLHSAIKIEAKSYGNGAKASVYIDYKALNDYDTVPGLQVVKWANEGFHGGIEVEHQPHVWDDTIDNTINNGILLSMAINYLKAQGFDIKE